MNFVKIKAGSFLMGSPSNEKNRRLDELLHEVYLSSFEIMDTVITQKDWLIFMKHNPSYFKGQHLPVESVSWEDIQLFVNKLNCMEDGYFYSLPTEAQWEYVARAGTNSAYFCDIKKIELYGWIDKTKTLKVKTKKPNQWGIYDTIGNVWEWCEDWYESYNLQVKKDPVGPILGFYRVVRGGGWDSHAEYARSAQRGSLSPGDRGPGVGFRLVRTPK